MTSQTYFQFIHAIRKGDEARLRSILNSLQHNPELYNILSKRSRSGRCPLHYTLHDMHDHSTTRVSRLGVVQIILNSIPREMRLKYLKLRETTHGRTALHTAVVSGEKDVITALLEPLSDSDRFELITMTDYSGLTVLQQNISEEIRQLINLFIMEFPKETGSRRQRQPTGDQSRESDFVERLDDAGHQRKVRNPQNSSYNTDNTSTTYLTAENAMSQIETLLETAVVDQKYDVIVNLKNSHGETILHMAASQKRADIVSKILSALPRSTGQHWKLISQRCSDCKTALHCASTVGCVKIVQLLLDYSGREDGELVNIQDKKGCQAHKYAKTSELRKFLPMVETHYWKTFYRKPTVMIFYNTFERFNENWKREGAEEEKNDMVEFFRAYCIEPKVHVNFSKRTLVEKITNAVEEDHADISACIVVIMSHGEAGIIYDGNIKKIEIQKILDCLGNNKKLDLTPKVLILQCCQDCADSTRLSDCTHRRHDARPTAPLMGKKKEEPAPTYKIESPDTCIITSTLRGQPSHRGVLARALSIVSQRPNAPTNLAEIFPAVNREMGRHMREMAQQRGDTDPKQRPELNSTLEKIVTLRNPLTSCPPIFERVKAFLFRSS